MPPAKRIKSYARTALVFLIFSMLGFSLVIPVFTKQEPLVASSSSTIYSTSDDGYIKIGDASWDTAHDAALGDSVFPSGFSDVQAISATYIKGQYSIYRSFFEFDTSGLPDGATITNAYLNIYGYTNTGADVIVIKSTQGATLTIGDFDEIDFNTAYSSEFTGWSSGSYNNITLTDTSFINKTSYSYCAVVEYDHDYSDSSPTDTNAKSGCYYSDETGTSKDPYLYTS